MAFWSADGVLLRFFLQGVRGERAISDPGAGYPDHPDRNRTFSGVHTLSDAGFFFSLCFLVLGFSRG